MILHIYYNVFLLFLILLHESDSQKTIKKLSPTREIQKLERAAFSSDPNSPATVQLWKNILENHHPSSTNARIQIGLRGMTSPIYSEQENAFELLEEAYDSTIVDQVLPMPSPQGILLSSVIGRWRWERGEYIKGMKFLKMAQDATEAMSRKKDVCLELQMSTMIDAFPSSFEKKMEQISLTQQMLQSFSSQNFNGWNEEELKQNVPGAANDVYVHCVGSLFNLELYYIQNIAHIAKLHHDAVQHVWPSLSTDYFLKKTTCRKSKKIKLGIASGLMNINTPVEADFKGMIRNLDRKKFEITFIISNEKKSLLSPILTENPKDKLIEIQKDNTGKDSNGDWVIRYHDPILKLDLDVLLFLDVTMSSHMHRLAMSKLAPVQAVSHGHPITSGFPKDIMNYYISWANAELPIEQASTQYTEQLKLLPLNEIHQYYYRVLKDDGYQSSSNFMDFSNLLKMNRHDAFAIDTQSTNEPEHWYMCMQKPFKFQPEFDTMLCDILTDDPLGRLVLHDVNTCAESKQIFIDRLYQAGCDLTRIYFLNTLPHHQLLALYMHSDVILDSYPAGGCTTTREALEVGKVVITLPSILLGSRWTLGYYSFLGDDILTNHAVAETQDDYVKKAVALGRNATLRKEMEGRVEQVIDKLFGRMEAVKNWENILLDIALDECINENEL